MGRDDLGNWAKYIHLHLNQSFKKAGAFCGTTSKSTHLGGPLLWSLKHCHAWDILPSQITQLDKRNLISTDILVGGCHCLQQTLSTTSLTETLPSSCTATPDWYWCCFLTATVENNGDSSSLQKWLKMTIGRCRIDRMGFFRVEEKGTCKSAQLKEAERSSTSDLRVKALAAVY